MDITAQAVLHPSATPVPAANSKLTVITTEAGIPATNSGNQDDSPEVDNPTSMPEVYECDYITSKPVR